MDRVGFRQVQTALFFGSSLMSTILKVGSFRISPTRHDELKPVEPPDTEQSYQFLKDREVTPDLRHICPICGNPYQTREDVLALGCLSFATGDVSAAPGPSGCDQGNHILLGHYECVLPRLLTLLASFRPDDRFVRAVSAEGSALRDRRQDQP